LHPLHKPDKQRDWYKVEIETLKGLGIFLALVVVAVGGFFGFRWWEAQALEREAGRVIDEARVLFQQLSGERNLDSFRQEYEEAWAGIEQARTHFAEGRFRDSLERGRRSRDVLLSLLDAASNRRESGEAQFLVIQGRVEFRRGERGEWEPARSPLMLRSGDYVKTSANGSAEIMFVDGTLYTVRPNTLFLVAGTRPRRGAAGADEQSIELQYGWINLNTAQRASNVATPHAEARLEDESEGVVTYDGDKATGTFTTFRGAMEVATAGERRRVAALETVSQEAGALSETRQLPGTPQLLRPGENEDVDLDSRKELVLAWRPVSGAQRYALQVSRSRLFADNIIAVDNRRKTEATLGLRGEGSFVWRVAAIGGEELQGPWSAPSRFRVASIRGSAGPTVRAPPPLEIESVQSYGSIFIVSGITEPGASVWINGESVAVEADGAFTKTIQLAQQGWSFIETRASDAWGNEATRRNRVFVESL
jgi:hypothetical protein